jgi:hypothetical protein
MATLADLSLEIAQTAAQKRLGLLEIRYGYRLVCHPVEVERDASFEISVDVLGHDPVRDDLLAERLDTHIVESAAVEKDATSIAMVRTLLLGQALLDEDIGDDEIKLRVRARAESGDVVEALTPVVHGRF